METYFKQIGIVDGQLEIDYKPNLNLSMTVHDIQLLLDQSIQKEVLFKNSILGPHRDDFQFMINGHLCRDYYSRGVSRVVSYLFQLSIAVLIQRDTSLSMLLLLDEPFAEIFHTIKKKLIEYIPKSFYIIYTSTQTDEISELSKDSIFKIDKGVLCKI